jgi:hypothetical protein
VTSHNGRMSAETNSSFSPTMDTEGYTQKTVMQYFESVRPVAYVLDLISIKVTSTQHFRISFY